MGTHFRRTLLLVGACLLSGLCSLSPAQVADKLTPLELTVEYQSMRANTVAGRAFWTEGGGLSAAWKLTGHWSVAADFSAQHTGQMTGTNAGLDLITVTFGPRYTMKVPRSQVRVFGQALAGPAHGSNSVFPSSSGASSSASGVALLVGGGVDYPLTPHWSVRALDAGWMRSTFLNGTTTVQNSLRVGAGMTYRF